MILNNRIEVFKQFPLLPCFKKKKKLLSPTMSGWLPFFPVLVYQNLKDFSGLLKVKALINLFIR